MCSHLCTVCVGAANLARRFPPPTLLPPASLLRLVPSTSFQDRSHMRTAISSSKRLMQKVKSVRDVAEEDYLCWLEMGSNRRAGDSDSDDNDVQPVQVSRKRQEQFDTARTPKSCALKPKFKRRKLRLRSRHCVGQSWLSRQRRPKATTTTATSTRASG